MADFPTYRQASFKGVPFFVDNSSKEFGRRGAEHEFVNEDLPYFEDLGRKAHRYDVEVFVIGEDHLEQAQRLEKVLESAGEGQLVLPSRQSEMVFNTNAVRNDDTRNQKGITRFSLTFMEAGEFRTTSALDTIADLLDAVSGAIDGFIDDVRQPILSLVAGAERVADAASRLKLSVSSVGLIAGDIGRLNDAISQFGNAVDPIAAMDVLIDIAGFQSAVAPVVIGPSGTAQYTAALEFDVALRSVASIQAAGVAAKIEYANRTDAIRIRERVRDALVQDISSMSLVQVVEIQNVYRAFMIDMSKRIAVLPGFVQLDLGQSYPSVVAAHRAYGDYTREAELREINPTYHPLFMPQIIEFVR